MGEISITDVTIDEVVIPDRLERPDAADFLAAVGVRNAVIAHDSGTRDDVRPPAEIFTTWRKQDFEPKRMLVARLQGGIVARGVVEYRLGDAADTAWLEVQVVPELRGHGIGRAVAERLESVALSDGRTKGIVYAPSWVVGGERLPSPTGFGDVPAGSRETRLLRSLGYELEQVERGSRLALPVAADTLDSLLERASAAAGADYRLHLWGTHTPPEWRDDIAYLLTRMSTDAPSAGLEEAEDPWTVERLLADEEEEAEGPRTPFVAAVEHVPTGHLVGFTELAAPAEYERPIDQEDTIVLREHRGHRLGMLLKAANLAHVQRVRPGHPAITTYNAEENRHMLAVNEALGFTPFVYEGAWRKNLVPHDS